MSRKVRVSRVVRSQAARLERERETLLEMPEAELNASPEWFAGFYDGLGRAKEILRDSDVETRYEVFG